MVMNREEMQIHVSEAQPMEKFVQYWKKVPTSLTWPPLFGTPSPLYKKFSSSPPFCQILESSSPLRGVPTMLYLSNYCFGTPNDLKIFSWENNDTILNLCLGEDFVGCPCLNKKKLLPPQVFFTWVFQIAVSPQAKEA